MTNADKVKLIGHVVADVMEYCDGADASFLNGVMNAIGSICDYEDKEGGDA